MRILAEHGCYLTTTAERVIVRDVVTMKLRYDALSICDDLTAQCELNVPTMYVAIQAVSELLVASRTTAERWTAGTGPRTARSSEREYWRGVCRQ